MASVLPINDQSSAGLYGESWQSLGRNDNALVVYIFLALVFKVLRNRFRCHSQSVAEPAPSKLFNFGHTVPFADRITTKNEIKQ